MKSEPSFRGGVGGGEKGKAGTRNTEIELNFLKGTSNNTIVTPAFLRPISPLPRNISRNGGANTIHPSSFVSIRERTFKLFDWRAFFSFFINNFITCGVRMYALFIIGRLHDVSTSREGKSLSFNEPNESSFETIDSSTGGGAPGLIIFSRESKAAACSFNCFFVPLLFPRGFYLFSSGTRHARPLWNLRHSAIENDLSQRCTPSIAPFFRFPLPRFLFFLLFFFFPSSLLHL